LRLLLKTLGMGMPESVVREELESLDNRVLGVRQVQSCHRYYVHTNARSPKPLRSARAGCVESAFTHLTLRIAIVGEDNVAPKFLL
jgi:hypothetical protein